MRLSTIPLYWSILIWAPTPLVASPAPSFGEVVGLLLQLRSGRVLSTTTGLPATVSLASPPMNGRKRRRVGDDDPHLVTNSTPSHMTRSVARGTALETTAPPPVDMWRLDWLSPSRPRLFLNSFNLMCKLVIVSKMIDIFQRLVPAPSIPPLMETLRSRVRRAIPSLHNGWEYDLDDFVFYLLSKRRIDRRIHDLLSAKPSPPDSPAVVAARLRFPDMMEPNVENIIDWHNNVIVQNGLVIVSDKFAIMTVSQFIRTLTNLQNELVQSARSARRQRNH